MTSLSLSFWAAWFGTLAAALALAILGAGLAQLLCSSLRRRRALTQASLLSVCVIVLFQVTDLPHYLAYRCRLILEEASWDQRSTADISQKQTRVRTDLKSEKQDTIAPAKTQVSPANPAQPISDDRLAQTSPAPLTQATERESRRTAIFWPLVLWVSGAMLLLFRFGAAQIMVWFFEKRQTEPASCAVSALASEIARQLNYRGKFRVLNSRRITGPAAFGVWKPTIILPIDFDQRFEIEEQKVMLAHELAHLALRDPLWNWIAETAVALAWWHPLVWWGRRYLRDVSEAAADEASALLEGGPTRLAQCLVRYGKEIAQERSLGWLGISAFRSSLGRRVQHLLNLKRASWSGSRSSGIELLAGTFLLLASSVAPAVWAETQLRIPGGDMKSWQSTIKNSLAGIALFALVDSQPAAAADRGSATQETSRKQTSPAPSMPIAERLNEIIIPEANFAGVALADVVTALSHISRSQDLHKNGVNFLISDRQSASSEDQPVNKLGRTIIRFTQPLRQVRLVDVLDAITKVADRPVHYEVTGYGVVFLAGPAPDKPAAERPSPYTYTMDPALAKRYGLAVPPKQPPTIDPELAARYGRIDPELAARYGLAQSPTPGPENRASDFGSAAAARIRHNLEQIKLAEVTYDGIPLRKVLEQLAEKSQELDPQHKGIQFLISPRGSAPAAAASNASSNELAIDDLAIRFTLPLRNVSLRDLLDAIVQVSPLPMEYSIQPYAIVFSAAKRPTDSTQGFAKETLETRVFQAETETLLKNFQQTFGLTIRADNHGEIEKQLRQVLRQLDVNLDQHGKSLIFNPANGMILIRAGRDELKSVDAAMQTLGAKRVIDSAANLPGTSPSAELFSPAKRDASGVRPGVDSESRPLIQHLQELQAELKDAKQRYTDQHPQVQQLNRAISQAEAELHTNTAASMNQQPTRRARAAVIVLGEVNKPGRYDLPPNEHWTVIDALAVAGGFSSKANRRNIEFTRGSEMKVLTFEPEMRTPGSWFLQPGDIIEVRPSFF